MDDARPWMRLEVEDGADYSLWASPHRMETAAVPLEVEQAIREPLESRLEALEAAVRETVDNATIREHGEVWCGECLKDIDTPSPECNICRLRELTGQEVSEHE